MEAYLVSTSYGVFLVDADGNVIIGRRSTGDGSVAKEVVTEAKNLGFERIFTYERGLSQYAEQMPDSSGSARLYSHERFGNFLGLTPAETSALIREAAMRQTTSGITEASGRRDKIISQVINAVDEFDETLNVFASRVREWYGLHFPELGELIEDNQTYLRLVSQVGLRGNFTSEKLSAQGLAGEKMADLVRASTTSIGASLTDEDFEPIRIMSEAIFQLYSLRSKLSGYIERLMKETAPNLYGVAGPAIGARLIALAGDLDRLAKFPSSTVQVLGAEKALFRAMRRGARPPKHGVIFQDPLVHNAPRWQRGKIARAYAGKLSIAARVDLYHGADIASKLRADFESRVAEIKTNFPNPPKGESQRREPEKETFSRGEGRRRRGFGKGKRAHGRDRFNR
jgi:nucleolar protein 56